MNNLLTMKGMNKSFGNVNVLKDVDLEVTKGEIHALMGENGAGKSTLVNILGGVINKDSGTITIGNEEIPNMTPDIAKRKGIGFVHQELNLAEDVTVAENVYLGRLPYKNEFLGIIDFDKLYNDTQSILNMLDVSIKPTDVVSTLSTANKQLVEIARALSLDAKLIIFDEPTTSLSDADVEILFIIIEALKDKGVSSIYISHRMNEIYELCDRITILRDGERISTDKVSELTEDQIIHRLVGRSLDNLYPSRHSQIGDVALSVHDLSGYSNYIQDVNFHVRAGEVIGFSGLVGSGRTEVMRMIFGADPIEQGIIKIHDTPVKIDSPIDAINNSMCLLTEDRKHQGLALDLSVKENIDMSSRNNFILDHVSIQEQADYMINSLNIRTPSRDQIVRRLSGGNQQKVVLAKWLSTEMDIYIFDEPTKGIDVGAKTEIYSIINQLAEEGKAIILVSSEIPELLGTCDRIYVMNEGRITGEEHASNTTQEKIMSYATLGKGDTNDG